jgi:tyramine---L-glutamate ligase
MRLFVYEHLCAVPGPAPPSLRAEGRAMLAAVLADFAAVPGVEVVTLLAADPSPPLPLPPSVRVHVADNVRRQLRLFRSLAADAAWTLVVAPETGLVLWRYCCAVEDVGSRLLGPSPQFVALTTDKFTLAERWLRAGVPTPWACLLPAPPGRTFTYPLVLKPRDGAGSQATFLLRRAGEVAERIRSADAAGFHGEFFCTGYVPGMAASVAVLAGPQGIFPLPAVGQRLSGDGRFQYEGGSLPLDHGLNRRATVLALQAVRAVPGLFGYVGVDLVLGDAGDGSQDYAIEINPRLTTSYLGYRRLCRTNLAEAMLTVCRRGVPNLDWHPGPVRFSPSDVVS